MANANKLEPILNPLFIDVVVDKLFEYLSIKDIINQRRVCTLWQQIGLKRLKTAIDTISISFNREKSIEKFLEMAKGFSFKFTTFHIRYLNDNANSRSLYAKQRTRLFDEYGAHMKVISLNLCNSTNSFTFLSDVLVNKAPNVYRLYVEKYMRRSEATRLFAGKQKPELKLKDLLLNWHDVASKPMHSQVLSADLFACSPYLESLTIAFGGEDEPSIDNYWIEAILHVSQDKGNISNLKELSLNVGDDVVFEVLATSFKSAPLEIFWYGISDIDLLMLPYIETFFADHKDTMKDLNIAFPCVEFLNKFDFPTMNNLKVLSIDAWICFNGDERREHQVPFRIFDFGKLFPNLHTLRLCETPMSERHVFFNLDEMFPEEGTPLLSLKNLYLPPISNPDMLCRIGRIFPNVLKLSLPSQTPDVLRKLWKTWPEIKTLNIWILPYESFRLINLDSVFTGVDGSDSSGSGPSISYLRKLKHLRIGEGLFPSGSANVKYLKIKDETARMALAQLKELLSLQISANRHEISSSCVQYLCAELGMLTTETQLEDGSLHLVKYEWQKRSWNPNLLEYE